MYNIPLFNLNFDEKEANNVLETIGSGWISMGLKCQEFEDRFASMLGCKHACSLTNCTSALHLACVLAEIKSGDEVICPSLTFAATVNCIRYVGATPVFADICGPDNLCMDADKLEELITPRTKAIIPMHFAGFSCDMDKIMTIAYAHKLKVIEDACHGPLSEFRGKKLGTIGDMGCFSFFSNKNISTGEGGMLVTDDDLLFQRAKLLRSHGMTVSSYQRASDQATNYDIAEVGYNYRMDDVRASIGLAQLEKIEEDLRKRAQVRSWYIAELSGCDGITIPFMECNECVSNYIFPIVLNDSSSGNRDKVRSKLRDKGIHTSIHYPALHRLMPYQTFSRSLPETEYVADNEITLPMFAKLDCEQVSYICNTLREII